jgi:hypothetical protein
MERRKRRGTSSNAAGWLALALGTAAVAWAAPPGGLPANASNKSAGAKGNSMLTELDSEDVATRQRAMAAILKGRQEGDNEIAALLEQRVQAPDRQGTVKDCMLLLGRLHATVHVPLLVSHLTFEAFYKNTKRPQTLEDLHPAIPALIDMGSPSIQPVLDRVKAEDAEIVQRAGAAVLGGVLGKRRAILIVEDEVKRTSPASQARLARVLEFLRAS